MLVAGSTRTAIAALDAFLVSAERAVEHAATATITLTVPSRTVRVFICASIGTMIEVLTTLAIREKKESRTRRAGAYFDSRNTPRNVASMSRSDVVRTFRQSIHLSVDLTSCNETTPCADAQKTCASSSTSSSSGRKRPDANASATVSQRKA